jgi:ABC-type transporter Mla subunit MlaD
VLRRPYRERLRLILAELGTGLAGRRAHPGLRETNETLRILADQNRIIQRFIRDADTVLADLEERKRDVARWVTEAGETSELSASRREALAGQFRELPGFLGELEPTMQRLGSLADEQRPLLRDLQAAAPDLETFFSELGPFARQALPAIRSLGSTARTGREALRQSSEEVRELRELAAFAPRFAKPLSQVLQTLDDRDRSVYRDPRAAETDPPAPDPTAGAEGYGFTGFETLLNYPYWQTNAISAFDEVSHMLRVVAHDSRCADYQTGHTLREQLEHDPRFLEDCAAWLGPDQPGITTEDPTEGPRSGRSDPLLDFLLAP